MTRVAILPVVWIVALSFLLRLAVILALPQIHISSDSREYIDLSLSLYSQGEFVYNGQYESLRTPGYPFFLSLIWHGFGPESYRVVACIQALLSACMTGGIFLLTGRLFHHRAAMIAAFLYAINPGSIMDVGSILTETLFGFLVLSAFIVLLLSKEKFPRLSYFMFGLLLGCACLVRPIIVWLYIPFVVLLWIFNRADKNGIPVICMFLIGLLLTQGAWAMRNKAHYGEAYLSELPAAYMYIYWAQYVDAKRDGADPWEYAAKAIPEFDEARTTMTPVALKKHFNSKAFDVIDGDYLYCVWGLGKGVYRQVIDPALTKLIDRFSVPWPLKVAEMKSALLHPQSVTDWVRGFFCAILRGGEALLLLVLFMGVLATGHCVFWGQMQVRQREIFWLLFMAQLYLILAIANPLVANSRLREQYMPILLILSVPALDSMVTRIRRYWSER
jgi:4-amino-4-deoxy-L-arabinose transferase-like glycosyltransferase